MNMEGSELEENLRCLLSEKKFSSVLEELKNPKNDAYVSENVWNLINLVCLSVKTDSLLKSDDHVSQCKSILLLLVNKGNPKEALIALLEQADSFKDHELFCLLLDPLKCALQKTPGKRGKSLQWVLSTLNAHIETLSKPENLDLQGEEKLLLDVDPAVQEVNYVLSNYFSFIQYFVDEVAFESLKNKEIHYFDRIKYQQELMSRYILKLFYQPLLYHDLHVTSESRPKSTIRTLCERYVNCLSKICNNVFNLFKYDSINGSNNKKADETSADEDNVPLLAFANFSYLIFVENMTLDFQPFVYSHLFTFIKNLKYITLLLKLKENLVIFKGLRLAENLLYQLDDLQLNFNCIELEALTEFPKLLLDVAICCDFETHRNSAINLFISYMSKCNYECKYHLIMEVLSTVKHSGAESLVISVYKNCLHKALNNDTSAGYFLGKNFNLFAKKIFVLSDGVETDIIKDSDKIMASLNFLRYILIRDTKEKNVTGIWDLIRAISTNFITPLTTGIDFSRAHYKQAIKDIANGKNEKDLPNTVFACNDDVLPNVPIQFKRELLEKFLVTFDVIESILYRVKELM